MELHCQIRSLSAIPTAQNLNRLRVKLDSVEDFEILLHNEASDSRPLAYFWKSLWKEAQALTALNNDFAEFASGDGIVNGDAAYNPLKIVEKSFLEDYFEVHSRSRARTSLADQP